MDLSGQFFVFQPVREGFLPPPALQALISGAVDSAARPVIKYRHD
jgi:hypothetical protein